MRAPWVRLRRVAAVVCAVGLSGCAHAWEMGKPCPAGTAWTYCDGVPQCAPAGVSPCGPNQVPIR